MTFNFPNAPIVGQSYSPGAGLFYQWDGTAWRMTVQAGAVLIRTGDTPPLNPLAGELWFESDTGNLYVYYDDGDSAQWVHISGATGVEGPTGLTGPAGEGFYDTAVGMAAVYVSSEINALHTSGFATVGDGGAAEYKRALFEPSHAGKIHTADGAWWELAERETNAKMFGAVEEGADAAPAIQAFFDHAMAVPIHKAKLEGKFNVASGLVIDGTGTGTRAICFELDVVLQATAAIDTMVLVANCGSHRFPGKLELFGTGSVTFASRTCRIGVDFENCGRIVFGKIDANYFTQWGVWQFNSTGNGFNNNLAQYETIAAYGCGSGKTYNQTTTYSGAVNSGTSASLGQRTTITVAEMPPVDEEVRNLVMVVIDGEVYSVQPTNFDDGLKTLALFPQLNPLSGLSGTLQYIYGGAVGVLGNNNGVVNFGQIDATFCGVAMLSAALYGSIVHGGLTAQNCGVGLVIGNVTTSVYFGSSYAGFYCEANQFDIVKLTTNGARSTITGVTGDPQYSKIIQIRPRIGTALPYRALSGVNYIADRARSYWQVGGTQVELGSSFGLEHGEHHVYFKNSWTINLTASLDINSLFGGDGVPIWFVGTGSNQSPTGAFTFNAPAGWTMAVGGTSLVIGGFTGPAGFVVKWDFRDLTIKVLVVSGRPGSSQTLNTNAAFSLTPGTSPEQTLHTGTLTADRAVTLSTTNAYAGQRFKITRTGGGAFNLTVGTGPLKALATNTWCEVCFDGTAWFLAAYGTL